MAVGFESISGKYDKSVEDSNTQASNKFTKSSGKSTDDMQKPSDKGSAPKQGSSDSHPIP